MSRTDLSATHSTERAALFSPIPVPWNRTTGVALVSLFVIWAGLFAATWASWGSVSVDCGRELYVSAALAQKQTLYRDVWYLYGPLGPYFNAFLFRIFGIRLEVFYWAGAVSALGSAIFLYLAGMRLSSWLAGWTTGTIVLIQAFVPSLFCFPLPYSIAAVYGCLIACLLLWLGLCSMESAKPVWVFAAGAAACAALLLKLEYGTACYAFLFLVILVRAFQHRSAKLLLFDFFAVLPGIITSVLVVGWMISLRGVDFITQENMMSWPTNYFMKTYGKVWLGFSGVTINDNKMVAIWSAVTLAIFVFLVYKVRYRSDRIQRYFFLISVAFTTLVAFLAGVLSNPVSFWLETVLRALFFPRAMVLLVVLGGGAIVLLFWRRKLPQGAIRLVIVCAFSALLASRLFLNIHPAGYSIYYDGPLILSFLLLGQLLSPATIRFRAKWELLLCFGCLTTASMILAKQVPKTGDWIPLKSTRGTIRVPPALASRYSLALDFMKQRAVHGEYVLSVPEDTGLYFLSETLCPSRVLEFTPGVLAPGKMTQELIGELESKPVQYLLWSNRTFPEFGAPIFGTDYDQFFAGYLRTHYRPLRSLTPPGTKGWSAVIWERIPSSELR